MWRVTSWSSCLAACSACVLLFLGALVRSAGAAGLEGVPGFGHVFVLMGENQGLNRLTPARSPYLSQSIKPRGGWLRRPSASRSPAHARHITGIWR